MYDMTDRVAIVTGGGGAIGRAASIALAQCGASILVADIDPTAGGDTADQVRSLGAEASFVRTDVSDAVSVQAMVEGALEVFGRLDYAFNNAGTNGRSAPLAEQSVEDWKQVIAVTLSGVFYGLKYQIPVMLDQGFGAIVNTSSTAGLRGSAGLSPYSAAKHGINGLTKSAALDYGAAGIRVNSLCPGGTRTPMLEGWMSKNPGVEEALLARIPAERLGTPSEMAAAVVWLCSDAASFVNGAELVADGGTIAR